MHLNVMLWFKVFSGCDVKQNHHNYVPEHREISVNHFITFLYFLVIHIVQTLELLGEASTAGGTRASVASVTS